MVKKIFFLIVFCFFVLSSKQNIFANQLSSDLDYKTALKEFLRQRPSLFYTESEKSQFISDSKIVSNNFSFIEKINFKDLDNDNIPEIIITENLFEGQKSKVYKFIYDKYEQIAFLEEGFSFYKNSLGKLVLFEGSGIYNQNLKYSYVYMDGFNLLLDTIYYDGDYFYNKMSDKKYDKNDFFNNHKLLDSSIVALKEMDFSKEFNEVKKEIRTSLDLGNKNKNISVLLNNTKIPLHANPIIKQGRILVPVKSIADSFSAKTTWNEKTKEVTIESSSIKIILVIKNNIAKVNGKEVKLDIAPEILENRTMLPMRFIIESLNGNVAWTDSIKTVNMSYYPEDYIENAVYHTIQEMYFDTKIASNFKNKVEITDIDNAEKLMFWTNEKIFDLKFNEVTYENDDFKDGKLIYSTKVFEPNNLLILKTVVPEGVPRIRITYVDEFGLVRKKLISYDGR